MWATVQEVALAGKIVIPAVAEDRGETSHDEHGRFCPTHKALTVTKNGERYKPVRQLRKIKGNGSKTRSKHKPPQEETVISVIGASRDREAVDAMLEPSGQWQTVAEVLPKALREM